MLETVEKHAAVASHVRRRYGSLDTWVDRLIIPPEMDPASDEFLPSRNRFEVYLQEIALYRYLQETLVSERLRERLDAEISAVAALRALDDQIVKQILSYGPLPGVEPTPGQARRGALAALEASTHGTR